MKIRRIHIDSFGRINNWTSPELKENLTLITGRNEAGKSTITEFIRSTLFPVRTSKYPFASKTDKGTIDLEMDNGERRTLVREQKKVTEMDGKRTPAEDFHIDPDTYRSLYGMDLEQLTNNKVLTSGEYRNKFLTVPGGENIPDISKDIQAGLNDLMNKEKMTDSKVIGHLLNELKNIRTRLIEIHDRDDEYDDLVREKQDILKEIERQKTLCKVNQDRRTRNKVIMSQRDNVDLLGQLRTQREGLQHVSEMPLEAKKEYDNIKQRLEYLGNDPEPRMSDEDLLGNDPRAVMRKESDIEAIWNAGPKYDALIGRREELNTDIEDAQYLIDTYTKEIGWTEKAAKKVKSGRYISDKAELVINSRRGEDGSDTRKKITIPMMIIGVIMVLAGLIGDEWLLFPVGAALIVLGLVLPRMLNRIPGSVDAISQEEWGRWIGSEGYPSDTTPERACMLASRLEMISVTMDKRNDDLSKVQRINNEISVYEKAAVPLCRGLGIEHTSFPEDIEKMHNVLRAAERMSIEMDSREKELDERANAEFAMKKFLRTYGTEAEFLERYRERTALEEIDRKIGVLMDSIETSSKLSIDELLTLMDDSTATFEINDADDDYDALSRRVGEIDTLLKGLLNDDEVADLLNRKTKAETDLDRAIREWAKLSLADHIISDACDHFYTDLQPSVVKTANLYMDLMTNGRYQLDSDPRESDIVIVDSVGKKSCAQWSSGLGDQVFLSVKMALAKEMGNEKMPLILDDVMVRFDVERKQGACRAIQEFARDRQVIMFTCDSSLYSLFSLEGKLNDVKLSGIL